MTNEDALLESIKLRTEFFKQIATVETGFFVVILFLIAVTREFILASPLQAGSLAVLIVVALAFPVITLSLTGWGFIKCADALDTLKADVVKSMGIAADIKGYIQTAIMLSFVFSKVIIFVLVIALSTGRVLYELLNRFVK